MLGTALVRSRCVSCDLALRVHHLLVEPLLRVLVQVLRQLLQLRLLVVEATWSTTCVGLASSWPSAAHRHVLVHARAGLAPRVARLPLHDLYLLLLMLVLLKVGLVVGDQVGRRACFGRAVALHCKLVTLVHHQLAFQTAWGLRRGHVLLLHRRPANVHISD